MTNHTTLEAVRAALQSRMSESVTLEYPGYLSIAVSPVHAWNIGTANGTWAGDLSPADGSTVLGAFDTGIPEDSAITPEAIADAIVSALEVTK